MNKFLIALGLVAALAAPAAAGRLDNTDPTFSDQPQPAQQADVDYTSARSIQPTISSPQEGSFDKQRGDQGSAFGANGR